MVQLGFSAFIAVALGSIPSWETKISQASWYIKKVRERERERMEIVFTSGFSINANCWCNFDYMTKAFLNFFAYMLEYKVDILMLF